MRPTTRDEAAGLATQLVDGAADELNQDWNRMVALSHAASHAAIARSLADAVSLLEQFVSMLEEKSEMGRMDP